MSSERRRPGESNADYERRQAGAQEWERTRASSRAMASDRTGSGVDFSPVLRLVRPLSARRRRRRTR